MGNFFGLEFVDEDGERYDIGNWNAADENSLLEYLGNGVYARTFKFNKLAEDLELGDGGFKILIGEEWIGTADGANIPLVIPAGSTELTVVLKVTEDGKLALDSINTPDEVAEAIESTESAPQSGDVSMAMVYMMLLAGCALVAVGFASKRKAA